MNIIWLGHGSFRIETGDQVLLIDPWINDNPMLGADHHEAAIGGATHILVTHGHFDHTADIVEISKRTGAPVSGMVELAKTLHGQGAVEGMAFNMGGTIPLGNQVTASMVPACHSSSMDIDGTTRSMGRESGFIIKDSAHTLYFSGDTGLMADMDWIAKYYAPDIGILSAGGFFTMDMEMAAFAARTYFNFKTVIPCHYRTFDALAQSAEALAAGVPEACNVIEPEVMRPIAL